MSASSAYQDLRCRRTEMMHQEQVNGLNQAVHWMCGWRPGASIYVLVFVLEADISSTWYKDDVTYYTFDDFWDNNCQSFSKLFSNSLKGTCKYCVDGSICQFSASTNFRWSGQFLHCFIRCSFHDMLTNFYSNRLIFDPTQSKTICWHFFEITCIAHFWSINRLIILLIFA